VDIGYFCGAAQAFKRGKAAGMRKVSPEISQVPLLYRAIYGIRIMREQLFGVFSHDYTWMGDWL
jgi:hypothetical protein